MSVKGTWKISRWVPDEEKWDHVLDVPGTDDMFGDEIYDEMVHSGVIEDIDNYDVDGGLEDIVIMGKEAKYGDFYAEFVSGIVA